MPSAPVSLRAPADTTWVEWVSDMRGALALYVVWHHAALHPDDSGVRDGLWDFLRHVLLAWGHMSVDLFLVLSGFCLMLPLARRGSVGSVPLFLAKRAARMLLPYYAVLALTLLAIWLWIGRKTGAHWDTVLPVSPGAVVTHLLMIHSWWEEYATRINHPMWSVAVEFQLYFLFPLFAAACWRLGVWRAVALVTVVSYALWRATMPLGWPDSSPWGASLYYATLFTMGMGAAVLRQTGAPLLPQGLDRWIVAGVLGLMLAWAAVQVRNGGAVVLQLQSFFVGAAAMAVLLWSRHWGDAAGALPVWRRALRYCGERGYSVYLIHAPMLQIAWLTVVRPLGLKSTGLQIVALVTTGTLATLVAASLLYRFVERPAHEWARSLGRGGRQGEAPAAAPTATGTAG